MNFRRSQHVNYIKFIERNQKRLCGPLKSSFNLFHRNILKIINFLEKEPDYSEPFLKLLIRYSFTVLKNSTIHGAYHVTQFKRHSSEIILWLIILIAAAFTCFGATNIFWFRHYTRPMVIAIEKDYINWNITFPSLTLCGLNKINITALDEYVNESKIQNKNKLILFLQQLSNLTYDRISNIINFPEIHPNDYLKILNRITYRNDVIITTGHNETFFMQRVLTEMGICYTFNSKLSNYMILEYLIDEDDHKLEISKYSNDREYIVTIYDNEKIAFTRDINFCCEIYPHDPKEVPNSRRKIKLNNDENTFTLLKYNAIPLIASKSVRQLLIFQRKCRFMDESNLPHFPIYTMSLCHTECRIQAILSICKCIPFFYKRLSHENYCNVQGLKCIKNREDKINALLAQCKCEDDCDYTKFTLEQTNHVLWMMRSAVRWELSNTKVRLRRNVIFGYIDAMIATGNVCNFFLGISALTFIEIFWRFCIHLPINYYIKKKSIKKVGNSPT